MRLTSMKREIVMVIAEKARCKPERIGLHDDFEEDLGLDSLDRLDVMAAVEDELGVQIPDEQFSEIRNLDGLLKALDIQPREIAA
jgi:acyl carrier protein